VALVYLLREVWEGQGGAVEQIAEHAARTVSRIGDQPHQHGRMRLISL
jgi:hypothetical protein